MSEAWPDQTDMAYHMPLLEELASKAAVIVELGCGHGNGSTRAFERGLERSTRFNKMLISIDCDPERPQCVPKALYWTKILGRTEDRQTMLRTASLLARRAPDILYVDTDHTKDQLAKELEVWSSIAAKNTHWLFHDTWMFGQYNPMVEAIHEFCAAHPQWQYREITKESHGLGEMVWVDNQS